MKSICRTEKLGYEQTKLESEKTWVYAQKPRLKMSFKNSISRQSSSEFSTYNGKTTKENLVPNSFSIPCKPQDMFPRIQANANGLDG